MIPIPFAAPPWSLFLHSSRWATPSGLPLPKADWEPAASWRPPQLLSSLNSPRQDHDSVPGHRGVDFPATQGQRVRAVGSGTVTFAGYIAGKPVVSIELVNSVTTFGNRVRSTYEPVNSLVSTGSYVSAGAVIGYIDFSGRQSGHCRDSCLHFGLKVVDEATTRYLSPRILWRSLAVLHPSPVLDRSQILDGQFQKFFGASQR